MTAPRKIIRRARVREATGLSNVTIWRKGNDPDDDFPSPISLTPFSVGWFEDEIIAWQESRPRGFGQSKTHLEEHYERGAKNLDPDAAAA